MKRRILLLGRKLQGKGGNDILRGDEGNDRLKGGRGKGDYCDGGAGRNRANPACETVINVL